MSEILEIKGLIVLCKLSDGSIRSINTNRESEMKILDIAGGEDNNLSLSKEVISGINIEMPITFNSYGKIIINQS